MRARTYYINICSGSKLYWSYKLYLHTRFPETYSFDFADLSDATSLIIEDTMINNIIDPPALLAAWKSQYAPLGIGPSFVEWLTSNIYEPQGNMCALGLDMLDFIIPFIGIQDCQTISLTDSWWTSYNADSAISSDLGASANPIDIGQNKFITDSLSNTPPIPAHRISWNDAWYPFTNFLQSSINTFSSSIVASLKYGPKVTASQSVTCMQIGISCVNDICVENVNKCLSDLLGGVFNPNINICETYTCTSSSSSGSGSSSGSSTNSGSGVGSGSGSGSASATVCEDCSSLMNNRCHTLNITLDNLYTSPPYNPEDPFSQPQTRRSFTPVFPITFTGDSYYNSTIQTNYSLGYLTVNASITCSIEINPSTLLQRPYITLSVTATLPNTATASCREEYDVILDTISFSSNFYGSDCLDGTYNIDGPQYLTANTSNCSSTYPAPTISCSWNIGQKDSPCS
jgi:hypothetical protein